MTDAILTTGEKALRIALALVTLAWLAGALIYSYAGVAFVVVGAWSQAAFAFLVLAALAVVAVVWRVARRRGALLGLGTLLALGVLFFGTCAAVLTFGGA